MTYPRSAIFSLLACLACQTQAGGLWLSEYNQPAMGRAAAGGEAGSGDASDAFFNPAAMTRHKKSQLMVGGGLILPETEFDVDRGSALNGNKDSGDAGALTPSASVFYSYPYSDRLSLGISSLALTGSALDYNKGWVGRFQAQEVSLLVIGLVPSVGYRMTDKLSVGFSLPVMYSSLELKVAVPAIISENPEGEGRAKIDGDDVQISPSVSFLYEFSDHTRLGGRATHRFEFEYDGDVQAQFAGQVGITTEMTQASLARLGLSHDFNDRWTGYAALGWDNWSEMDDVLLSTNSGGAVSPRNWEDTWHYGVGVDYRLDDRWTLRSGIAYDSSPVNARDRTADMPLDEQWRYAVGADYRRDSGMVVSGSLIYADYGKARINNSESLPLAGFTGEYDANQIWFASLSFNWPLGGGER